VPGDKITLLKETAVVKLYVAYRFRCIDTELMKSYRVMKRFVRFGMADVGVGETVDEIRDSEGFDNALYAFEFYDFELISGFVDRLASAAEKGFDIEQDIFKSWISLIDLDLG